MKYNDFVLFRAVAKDQSDANRTHMINMSHVRNVRPGGKDGETSLFVLGDGTTIEGEVRYPELMRDLAVLKYGFR